MSPVVSPAPTSQAPTSPVASSGPDAAPMTLRPVGGQAVTEGVMMRGESQWAVAVRTADGSIDVVVHDAPTWAQRRSHIPVLRGVLALAESLSLGVRALLWSGELSIADTLRADESSDAKDPDVNEPEINEPEINEPEINEPEINEPAESPEVSAELSVEVSAEEREAEDARTARVVRTSLRIATAVGVIVPVALFLVGPALLTRTLGDWLDVDGFAFHLLEGLVRLSVFVTYLALVRLIPDIRRLYAYHGAEHKTIAAYEARVALTPESAQRFSTAHVRCGTNFLLTVMVTTIAVYSVVGRPSLLWLVVSRVALLPLIAGLAYEIIRAAARHLDRPVVRMLMAPGLALQRLTTAQPDLDQLEVAIVALRAALTDEQRAEVDGRDASAEPAQPWMLSVTA